MNQEFKDRVAQFMACRRIAVAGYSSQGGQPANGIYERLKDNGYEVFAVNPKAEAVQGVPCFPSLSVIPGGVEAVAICTPPQATMGVLEECAALGIEHAWIHRSVDQGSYVEGAEDYADEHGIKLIPAGCPLMFVAPDFAHRCMKWFFSWRGLLEAEAVS
ncbi:MAG: CoA-binding protein [Lewinellaceae bacterium]|nr:CoA-binding protein [Lewinellaceae bacterium]